jgi:glycosyltransferase involved in cell wall biosynthesis
MVSIPALEDVIMKKEPGMTSEKSGLQSANLSVVIPSYNSTKTLKRTIPSIMLQDQSLIQEVIIVDSSDDGKMATFMQNYSAYQKLRFIVSGVRIMPAMQRNIGAQASQGRLLLFLDADVVLEPDYIRKIVEHYNQGYLAGCGSVVLHSTQRRKAISVAQYYMQLNEYLPIGGDRPIDFPTGCNNFCDRDLFNAVGGFPELRAAEDVLYGLAIKERALFWFVPEAKVAHIFREDWSSFYKNQAMLGQYVARYRKQRSASFTLSGIMPLLLSPAFYAFKLLRIMLRIAKSGWSNILRFLWCSPYFLVGLAFWTIGFTKEARGVEP